jgi:DNA polymerase-3 subunit epsilon
VHGIRDEDVKDKPSFGEIAAELLGAFGARVPAAYNALFDKAFIMAELARAGVDTSTTPALDRSVAWLDPLVWAREIQQTERSRALGDVAARLGIELEKAHRAMEDAEAALRVLYALGVDGRVPRMYSAFVQEQRRLALSQADERRQWRNPS